MNHALQSVSNDTYFHQYYGVNHDLIRNYDQIAIDFGLLNSSLEQKISLAVTAFPSLRYFIDMVDDEFKLGLFSVIKNISFFYLFIDFTEIT